MSKTTHKSGDRPSTVYVSKEDKEALRKHCEEMGKILDKYPSTNDSRDHFVTTMMRLKGYFGSLKTWISLLEEEE